MSNIFLVGGGSGGHVQPSIAVAQALVARHKNIRPIFVCSRNTLDSDILKQTDFKFIRLFSGKLRRYFSFQNFIDWIFVIFGFFQSIGLILIYRPQVVFSKGGFVSLPMAFAAWMFRVPIILHESDAASGLANRIISKLAKVVCTGFPVEGLGGKVVFVGNPVRQQLTINNLQLTHKVKTDVKSQLLKVNCLLIMGGSQGAQFINETVHKILPELVKKYKVIHIAGKGKKVDFEHTNYEQYEYVTDELIGFYKETDLCICRSGANSLAELAVMGIPAILIPLPSAANNHQVKNAQLFVDKGAALMFEQKEGSEDVLLKMVQEFFGNDEQRLKMSQAMEKMAKVDAAERIVEEVSKYV